jgi:hypothetical protein
MPAVPPSPPRSTEDGWLAVIRRLAILIALYAVPVTALIQPVGDWDIWWHIRTGEWIEQEGRLPTTDPFSSYGEGRRWYAYSWLFELLVERLHRQFGLSGILLYRIVLGLTLAVAVHALIARREPRFVRATFLTGLTFFALTPLLQERSWMFSLVLYVVTLGVVLSMREGRGGRAVWLLPILYALGANLHVQFLNGLLLLGLACAAPVIDLLLRRETLADTAATAGTRAWWRLVALTGTCAAATLLNPYHVRLYLVVIELPTQAGVYQLIMELLPLSFRTPQDWAILALFALAVFTLGRRRRLGAFEVLLLAGSAYLSFRARRDLWCVVLASVAVLVGERPELPASARFRLTWTRMLVVAAGVAVVIAGLAWKRQLTESHMREVVAERFPEAAARQIEAAGYRGRLFSTYGWGGYLIWRLPSCQVALDGRANLHGDERIRQAMDTESGHPAWKDNADLHAAGYVILPAASPLGQILRCDDRFELVWKDKVAVVFRNTRPRQQS